MPTTQPPKSIDQLLREFRATLLGIDRKTASVLMARYRRVLKALLVDVAELQDALRRAGDIDDVERWVRDHDAAARLLAASERGMAQFGAYAAEQIEQRIHRLVELADEHDEKLTYASIVGDAQVTPGTASAIRAAFTAIPVEAVANIVGVLQPGSPLRGIFDEFGVVASRRLGEQLVEGMVRGEGAAQVARRLRDSLGGNATRALTIARTEMHRAYRGASLERYRANPRVYAGWRWHASLDGKTCPVCVAMHGTLHEVGEEFGSHPNCRCRPIPEVKPLADFLGDTPEVRELQARIDAAQSRETGVEWFAKQPEARQVEILGASKARAYREGVIRLDDVVKRTRHPLWGPGRRTASLREAQRRAARRGSRTQR